MKHTIFFKVFAVLFSSVLLISCDKDFNTLGADFIDNQHFTSTDAPGEDFGIKVINHKLGAVESGNLPINHLGISEDPISGNTRANYVTQLLLSENKPTINTNAVIDSVILTVPYFYKVSSGPDSNGWAKYKLDSISTTNSNPDVFDPMDLKVYETKYYLRDYDPNTGSATVQKYYTNQDPDFDAQKNVDAGAGVLNDDVLHYPNENTAFVPNPKQYVKFKVENFVQLPKTNANVETRQSPRMRLHLKTSFFQSKILDAAANSATSSNFINNNSFKSYFKGLYFQVQNGSTGSMMALDFTKGDVTIYYKQDTKNYDAVTNPNPTREMKALVLNMNGARTVNTFVNTPNGTSITGSESDFISGNKIYLRGGQGFVSYVDLFKYDTANGIDELQDLKNKKVLVNDASLYFTIDASQISSVKKLPQRIFIFDAESNAPLYDYFFDQTTNSYNDKLKKFIHGGILETITNADGITKKYRYKVRITEHISNVLRETNARTKNVRIGVAITESINYGTFVELKTPITIAGKEIKKVPIASVVNGQSAVIHGTDGSDDRIRFKIYYTKQN